MNELIEKKLKPHLEEELVKKRLIAAARAFRVKLFKVFPGGFTEATGGRVVPPSR